MSIDIEKSNLNILITGGAGFIGSCLVRRLLSSTNAKIFNLDKLSYASDLNCINMFSNPNQYSLLKIDLKNFKDTESAIFKADPDLIFHLAAESHVDRSIDDPKPFIESNIIGTFNILEATRKHYERLSSSRKNKFRMLHISTDEVFGSLGEFGKFSEISSYDPRSPYSASKASSDHLCNAWNHTFKVPIIRTNCSNNFGPYQFPDKLIPLVILKALSNQPIPVYGNGKYIRDWLYVEDHIDALIMTIMKGEIGSNYCIGANNEKTNIQIIESICNLLDKKKPSEKSYSNLITFVKDRPGHDKRYAINSNYIREKIGWQPKSQFNEALEKTINWYLKNIIWCEKIKKISGYQGERIGLKEIYC